MTNKRTTRSQLVLAYLNRYRGQWVSGIKLANEFIGGLRYGARIFDLRKEGYTIEARPSKTSSVYEYRLVA